ncbi:3-[(3aS,4S,7aS)-7a-methyl-1,5-dioxo-octahydro-1H-inden-4-yl]propanoyl:CoA ligase [Mycobacterium talmoniae]|uniref:3-[(3aS,4S,7aS)-7a-methyl-1, 5-dioxo-octahydro-1H-inden-4-yl]propanoyl:CoA ligase n=1 Tax=Mycobacterium talmoniae TaxID=1858794 RepID=A0A2S8BE00_9MYCO|nr:3-[(3aS,4S,7aS)-7a-methyl-1,5-dioxo-octahydro-1H-inden-4-yl]propanoyl:CoA ligase [Mycobacterium talmoniae]
MPSTATAPRTKRGTTRNRMIATAAEVLRERGAAGVTIDEVLARSGAPRGSVYHHFPGGKNQLLTEALHYAGDALTASIDRSADQGSRVLLAQFTEVWERLLQDSDFTAGCPVVAAAIGPADEEPQLTAEAGKIFGHWRAALGLTAADRIQVVTPPSHILGLLNILTALDTGAWLRLHRRFDVDTMLRHIESDRITVEMAVAPIALAIAAHPDLESFDLSSLRYIMWGATPVTASVADTVTARTGVRWLPAYGTSELPVIACSPPQCPRLDSVGRPVPGVQVQVVALDSGNPVPPGEIGEIWARADSLMAGYLPAEATAEVLRDGWYHTGDVGYLDADGWLRITDRCKEMIKVRGFQVAPAEVEAVLHGHPAVTDCAVFGVADPADGEAVVAAVTTRAPVTDTELAALVAERLASYKRPRRVLFVDEIPRLPSGKLLRRVLKERYGCPAER